jgi:hypothetical protein
VGSSRHSLRCGAAQPGAPPAGAKKRAAGDLGRSALAQWRLAVERARYETERAERRYRTVELENRLVARGLEAEWEQRLREFEQAQSELRCRPEQQPRTVKPLERSALLALGNDLEAVWFAPTTTPRDQKELLRYARSWKRSSSRSTGKNTGRT